MKTVLIAVPWDSFRRMIARTVGRLGYQSVEAWGVRESVRILWGREINLVVMNTEFEDHHYLVLMDHLARFFPGLGVILLWNGEAPSIPPPHPRRVISVEKKHPFNWHEFEKAIFDAW